MEFEEGFVLRACVRERGLPYKAYEALTSSGELSGLCLGLGVNGFFRGLFWSSTGGCPGSGAFLGDRASERGTAA